MKKLLTLFTIIALVFLSCDDPGKNDNSDVIGVWIGNYGNGYQLKLDISDGTWIMVFNDPFGPTTFNGTWERDGYTLFLMRPSYNNSTASLSGVNLFLTQNCSTSNIGNYKRPGTITLSRSIPEVITGTKLRIKNESFLDITDVRWNNTAFTANTEIIKNGNSVLKKVNSGSGYIYFKASGNPVSVRTNEVLTINNDDEKELIIMDNTVIVDINNTGNSDTLRTFFTKPWIIVKQGNTTINQYGEYNFESVLKDTDKDVTFTIENIGRENLNLINTDGKHVYIDGNNHELFKVIQQPLASSIAPGNSTSFSICFTPEAVGNNFLASVHINTNSINAQEFAFVIKGNGRNYIIGDTGPGGGTIFYAQGNQFKECSAELGSYNWNDAVSIAGNYQGGNLNDWYLPDRGELDMMYNNLHKINLGNFQSALYWSSTEADYYNNINGAAWFSNFYSTAIGNGDGYLSSGGQSIRPKSDSLRVRAVRAFTN